MLRKKYKNLMILAMAISLVPALNACSGMLSSASFTRDLTSSDSGVSRPDEFPILHATGYASISRQSGSQAEREIKAMRASKLDAYRELTEQLNGIYVNSKTQIAQSTRETADSIKTEVDGYVHGARVIRQYPVGDVYATELELDTKIIYDLYDIRGAL